MGRRVKEFVEVADHASIDELIEKLKEIRAELPEEANAELQPFPEVQEFLRFFDNSDRGLVIG